MTSQAGSPSELLTPAANMLLLLHCRHALQTRNTAVAVDAFSRLFLPLDSAGHRAAAHASLKLPPDDTSFDLVHQAFGGSPSAVATAAVQSLRNDVMRAISSSLPRKEMATLTHYAKSGDVPAAEDAMLKLHDTVWS